MATGRNYPNKSNHQCTNNHRIPTARMSTVVFLADYKNTFKHIQPDVCFEKKEFDQLLSVYSRRVMSGDWKDYAIKHNPKMAAFLIYRNNSQNPSFTIVKRKAPANKLEYLVYHGHNHLKTSASLTDALSILKRKLKLVNN